MNREQIRSCVDSLGERLRVMQSDGHGLVVRRNSGALVRLYTGGGIAGRQEAWIELLGFKPPREPEGPFATKKALRAWLKEWRDVGRWSRW